MITLIAQNVKQALLLESKGINVNAIHKLSSRGITSHQMVKVVVCPDTRELRAYALEAPESATEFAIIGFEFLEQLEKIGMKFYKVIPENLVGGSLGNSTLPTQSYSPICREEYVKVSADGAVWSMFDKPIWTPNPLGAAIPSRIQLFITQVEINELFVECKDPGPKVISNIRFVVGTVDYENFYEVESFTDSTEAINACQNFTDSDPDEYYQVRVEFDADWETSK